MLVTDESKARRAMSSVNGNSDIIYLPCEHSYQTLLDVRSVLENYFKEKRDGLFDILAGFGIFTKENVVKVILTDCSTQKINEFRSKVIDSDCIEFVIGEKIKE